MSEPSVMTHPLTGQACCLVPMEEYKSITDKLHAYEKQWTDMDYTIGHLRQENAELKAEVCGLKVHLEREHGYFDDLQKCKDFLIGSTCYCASTEHICDRCILIGRIDALIAQPSQPIQDPATHRIIKACLPYLRNDNTRQLYFEACKVLGIETIQDPATAIAYGLYPSSARPVNPKPSKSENWVGNPSA